MTTMTSATTSTETTGQVESSQAALPPHPVPALLRYLDALSEARAARRDRQRD